ncbi:bud emergence protein 1 [Sorochytrium milnesiophthora]
MNAKQPPGGVVKAREDYTSSSPAVLSFRKGDFFLLTQDPNAPGSRFVGPDGVADNGDRWLEVMDPVRKLRGRVPRHLVDVMGKTHTAAPAKKPSASALLVVATHKFDAQESDELSVVPGDQLLLVAYVNENWCVARHMSKIGQPGMLPIDYFQLVDPQLRATLPKSDSKGLSVAAFKALIHQHNIPHYLEWKEDTNRQAQSAIKLAPSTSASASASASLPSSSATHLPNVGRLSLDDRSSSNSSSSNNNVAAVAANATEPEYEEQRRQPRSRPSDLRLPTPTSTAVRGDTSPPLLSPNPPSPRGRRPSHQTNWHHSDANGATPPARSSSRHRPNTSSVATSSASVISNGNSFAHLPTSPRGIDAFAALAAAMLNISALNIARFEIRGSAHIFIIHVTFGDGDDATRHILHRTYEDFYDMHVALLNQFPVEAGRRRPSHAGPSTAPSARILPMFPSPLPDGVQLTERDSAIRRPQLQAYLQDLIALSRPPGGPGNKIVISEPVTAFFDIRDGDRVRRMSLTPSQLAPSVPPPAFDPPLAALPASPTTMYLPNRGSTAHATRRGSSTSSSSTNGNSTATSITSFPSPYIANPAAASVKIKVLYQGDMVAFRVNPATLTFAQMLSRISEKIAASPAAAAADEAVFPPQLALRWRNSATGESAPVVDDQSLRVAMSHARNGKLVMDARAE